MSGRWRNRARFCNLTDAQIVDFVAQVKTVITEYALDGVNFWDRNAAYGKEGMPAMNTTSYPKLIKAMREALGNDKLVTLTDYEAPPSISGIPGRPEASKSGNTSITHGLGIWTMRKMFRLSIPGIRGSNMSRRIIPASLLPASILRNTDVSIFRGIRRPEHYK